MTIFYIFLATWAFVNIGLYIFLMPEMIRQEVYDRAYLSGKEKLEKELSEGPVSAARYISAAFTLLLVIVILPSFIGALDIMLKSRNEALLDMMNYFRLSKKLKGKDR